nr:hypothetical protein [Streptomyces corchorusii]
MPRGFAHCATGKRGLSAHLPITVRDVGTADLGAALGGPLAEGLPAERPLGDEAITGPAERLLQDARDRPRGLSAADLVGMARRRTVALMPGRPEQASLARLGRGHRTHGLMRVPRGRRPATGRLPHRRALAAGAHPSAGPGTSCPSPGTTSLIWRRDWMSSFGYAL